MESMHYYWYVFWRSFKSRVVRRRIKYWWQRRVRGWDDSDVWNLDYTFAKYALPRLKRLREVKGGWCPLDLTEEKWDKIFGKIIRAMRLKILEADTYYVDELSKEKQKEAYRVMEEGYKLFGEWFSCLWW